MSFPERDCIVCGEPFRPAKANGKTCSGKCRTKLWWTRNKDQNRRFSAAVAGKLPLSELVAHEAIDDLLVKAGIDKAPKTAGKKRGRPRKPDSELKRPRRSKSHT